LASARRRVAGRTRSRAVARARWAQPRSGRLPAADLDDARQPPKSCALAMASATS